MIAPARSLDRTYQRVHRNIVVPYPVASGARASNLCDHGSLRRARAPAVESSQPHGHASPSAHYGSRRNKHFSRRGERLPRLPVLTERDGSRYETAPSLEFVAIQRLKVPPVREAAAVVAVSDRPATATN